MQIASSVDAGCYSVCTGIGTQALLCSSSADVIRSFLSQPCPYCIKVTFCFGEFSTVHEKRDAAPNYVRCGEKSKSVRCEGRDLSFFFFFGDQKRSKARDSPKMATECNLMWK